MGGNAVVSTIATYVIGPPRRRHSNKRWLGWKQVPSRSVRTYSSVSVHVLAIKDGTTLLGRFVLSDVSGLISMDAMLLKLLNVAIHRQSLRQLQSSIVATACICIGVWIDTTDRRCWRSTSRRNGMVNWRRRTQKPKRYVLDGKDRVFLDRRHHLTKTSTKALQAQDLLMASQPRSMPIIQLTSLGCSDCPAH